MLVFLGIIIRGLVNWKDDLGEVAIDSSTPKNRIRRKNMLGRYDEEDLADNINGNLRKVTTPTVIYSNSSFTYLESEASAKNGTAQTHIVFVKVHKAASTTIQNLFFRFSFKNQLNVLLRKSHGTALNESSRIINADKVIPNCDGVKYDILCNHIIFDVTQVSSFFPDDTVYITILREPFSQFLSAFIYYAVVWNVRPMSIVLRHNSKNPVEQFLNKSSFYNNFAKFGDNKINNRMSVDLGFPEENFEEDKNDKQKIKEFIDSLETTFDLVLIREMFDESIILLRRFLNWTTKDVLYIRTNDISSAMFYKQPNHTLPEWTFRRNYSEHTQKLFRKWAAIDIAVYEHFLEIFREKVRNQPPDFFHELKEFKNLRVDVEKICEKMISPEDSHYFPGTAYLEAFWLSQSDCFLMGAHEGITTNTAKKIQKKRYKKWIEGEFKNMGEEERRWKEEREIRKFINKIWETKKDELHNPFVFDQYSQ